MNRSTASRSTSESPSRRSATGLDGHYPLILLFHSYADEKLALDGHVGVARARLCDPHDDGPWLRGVLRDPGVAEADQNGCATGFVRMMDTRYEVRDAQELVGRLVDEGLVDRQRFGATGLSYGGAASPRLRR